MKDGNRVCKESNFGFNQLENKAYKATQGNELYTLQVVWKILWHKDLPVWVIFIGRGTDGKENLTGNLNGHFIQPTIKTWIKMGQGIQEWTK